MLSGAVCLGGWLPNWCVNSFGFIVTWFSCQDVLSVNTGPRTGGMVPFELIISSQGVGSLGEGLLMSEISSACEPVPLELQYIFMS